MATGGFLQWMAPHNAFMVALITLSELSHKKDMEFGKSVPGKIDEEKMGGGKYDQILLYMKVSKNKEKLKIMMLKILIQKIHKSTWKWPIDDLL